MINRNNLTIIAQMPGQNEFVEGIYDAPAYVAGIDQSIGLMAISSSASTVETSPARMAMEILMDDMRTNVPQFAEDQTESKIMALTVNCLQESLDNINEYLYSQVGRQYDSTAAVSTQLSAFQYLNGLLSYVLGAGVKSLILRNNVLRELSNVSSHLTGALGEKPLFESRVETEALVTGDIIFIASSGDISIIGEDFIRVTLSRFPKNLDTALRQINTKVARKGMPQIPGIMLCRIEQDIDLKRSWMNKLKKT